MGLSKYRLGDIILPYSKKCGISILTPDQVSGVNREKEFFEPSHQVGEDTSKYQIVPSQYFACNLMHVGRDQVLPIAYNHSGKDKIVSPAYTVFSLKKNCGVLDEYFFLMLKSDERDRFFWFHADSSVRDGMPYETFCDIEISVPTIGIQQKYVDIYKAMVANQQSYERGQKDLELLVTAYVEQEKHADEEEDTRRYILGDLIVQRREKYDGSDIPIRGVSKEGFIEPRQKNADLHLYNQYYKYDFVFNPARMELNSIALNTDYDKACCSSLYEIFYVNRPDVIMPEYLNLLLKRMEFARWCEYVGWGSAREYCRVDTISQYPLVVPSMSKQKIIVELYNAYKLRKKASEQLKAQIKDICPILIKGSLEEENDRLRKA